MDVPDHFFDDFVEDLSDPDCVQQIYDFTLGQVRGFVEYNDEDDLIQEVFYRLAKWPIGKKYNSKRHYFSLLKITIRQAIAAYWRRWHSQRVMFEMRFLEERSHEEVSSKLKISIRTSYRLETQVRKLLQEHVRSNCEDRC